MPALCYQGTFKPGDKGWHPCAAPTGMFVVVFEDDGDTGYFYACDETCEDKILDAVHIYNVANVTDRDRDSVVQIGWSVNGAIAALIINGYVHAVVDFSTREMCSRTGFPPASGKFATNHAWDPAVLERFERAE